MKYTLLALTTVLTLLTALPAKAGGRIWLDPYPNRYRDEVVVSRCYDNDWYYNRRYDDWYYNRPYRIYGCRERVIRRYPRQQYYRVYRRFDYPYRYDYDGYRYRRPGLRIRIGF